MLYAIGANENKIDIASFSRCSGCRMSGYGGIFGYACLSGIG